MEKKFRKTEVAWRDKEISRYVATMTAPRPSARKCFLCFCYFCCFDPIRKQRRFTSLARGRTCVAARAQVEP